MLAVKAKFYSFEAATSGTSTSTAIWERVRFAAG
jgi:hypothetical protein